MLGVFVNVITVLIGSGIGLLFRKGIPQRVSNAVMIGLGACTLYIGISGSLCGENVLILIGAIVLGAITGTLLDVDGAINKFAGKVEQRFSKNGDPGRHRDTTRRPRGNGFRLKNRRFSDLLKIPYSGIIEEGSCEH